MSQERRTYPRATYNLLPSDFKLTKNSRFSSSFYAQVKDISLLGVRLILSKPLSLGDHLLLSVSLPTDSVPKIKYFKIGVSVTWVSKPKISGKFEVGGTFFEISEEAKKAIRNFS